MLNPIPETLYCKTEIEAVKPIILNGDLTKIPVIFPERSESAAWSTEGRSFCKSIIFMFS